MKLKLYFEVATGGRFFLRTGNFSGLLFQENKMFNAREVSEFGVLFP